MDKNDCLIGKVKIFKDEFFENFEIHETLHKYG